MPHHANHEAAPRTLRAPVASDARHMWRLARDSGVLEANSGYAYLVLCTHFADTGVAAWDDEELAGFVTGYRPPAAADTLFVWQVATDHGWRGQGLAVRMLTSLLERPQLADVKYLEATVTPSNEASRRLFASAARALGAARAVLPHFEAGLFPESGHEPEELVRIGPFASSRHRPKP